MDMVKINPHENEAYRYTIDDHCLVVASGETSENKVWLSRSMIKWISENGLKLIAEREK